jgi:hypothetical protein
VSGEPAGSDLGADGVGAIAQHVRHVEGLVADALAIVGPAGGEEHVADATAVDGHLIDAEGGDIEAGIGDGGVEGERAAEEREGRAGEDDAGVLGDLDGAGLASALVLDAEGLFDVAGGIASERVVGGAHGCAFGGVAGLDEFGDIALDACAGVGVNGVIEGAGDGEIRVIGTGLDPLGGPVGGSEEAHGKVRGLTPRAGGSVFVPGHDLPEASLGGAER